MKKVALFAILLVFSAIFLLTSCSGKDFITARAEHFVRKTYNDVDRIISVVVDTVTLGENMDYRIHQARQRMEFSALMMREFGGESYEETLAKDRSWKSLLDSLKVASADVLGTPTAYNCIVTYNDPGINPGCIVWVQLDPDGNLLNITKEPEKVLLNPGGDVPGYFEVWERFYDR